MDTKYLSYILEIAERKNMTKAAEQLHVSQSSLSQYLAKLEQEIGAPLFVRAKGELCLTASGKLYADAAQRVIDIKKELYDELQSLNQTSHISVGVTSNFGLTMMAHLIPDYKKHYPGISIEISETNVPALTRALQMEEIDCGIMALNTLSPFLPEQIHLVRQEEVLLAVPASHPFRKRHPEGPVSSKDFCSSLKNEDFILGKRGSTLRYLAEKAFSNARFHPTVLCETNNISSTLAMVAQGAGISFIARSCISPSSQIAYYSMDPVLHRYNALVCRQGWVLKQPEHNFIHQIERCFDQMSG